MKIVPLKKNDKTYCCNSYLLLGDWNRVGDINTLVDPGVDSFILGQIEHLSTGFGKVAIEQIILTHNHFDHAAGALAVKKQYGSRILAWSDGPGIDELLPDGRFVKAADDFLEVIHTPGHSSDSICLYAPAAKTLFSGDTQFKPHQSGNGSTRQYMAGLTKLAERQIDIIYSGHDAPITDDCARIIRLALDNLRQSI